MSEVWDRKTTQSADCQYRQLVDEILFFGDEKQSRAGDVIGIFGHTMRFDLRQGFPLLTTKKINFDYVYYELMAFLRGETNIKGFEKCKKLWQDFADPETGDLGRIYGAQWVDWQVYEQTGPTTVINGKPIYVYKSEKSINQIEQLIYKLKNTPNDRRMVVSAWNPAELDQMKLPPCHMFFQCYVSADCKHLDLMMYQRSCDVAIGVPFNIASYSLLLTMLAHECGYKPRYFTHVLGDAHIYKQHIAGLRRQQERKPYDSPTITPEFAPASFFDYAQRDNVNDWQLHNYKCHPYIKFELNV